MSTENTPNTTDPEIEAISQVYSILKSLDSTAQARVIQYVTGKLGIHPEGFDSYRSPKTHGGGRTEVDSATNGAESLTHTDESDSTDGISPVAQKWMKRSSLEADPLSKVFSLGGDEIDLIASSVPGSSKKTKMHSVILLKGIAAYLGSGAARVSHQQIKETCLHYDAYDSANFATYLKGFAAEVSGTKESGYTLTQRGLAAATELVKQLINSEK